MLLQVLRDLSNDGTPVFIDMIASYGMSVGATVFENMRLDRPIRRSKSGQPPRLVYRKDVKMHLCCGRRPRTATFASLDRQFGDPGRRKAVILWRCRRYVGSHCSRGYGRRNGKTLRPYTLRSFEDIFFEINRWILTLAIVAIAGFAWFPNPEYWAAHWWNRWCLTLIVMSIAIGFRFGRLHGRLSCQWQCP